jgi:alpha-beta hydrolase superfamily lysophospholipase
MRIFISALAVVIGILMLAIAFGGPHRPAEMASINAPFKSIDFSDLPTLETYQAKDGVALSFRTYRPKTSHPLGAVVLVHGSSANSNSMHVLAKALAKAGLTAYALDMRGHGSSGKKGSIQYIGQLEDDLVSFSNAVLTDQKATLLGFSSGGGFVMRFAGSAHQDRFQSYLLMSPFISQDAPNYRPNSGGWVNVGLSRLMALSLLNGIGITAFNGLTVTSFAVSNEMANILTPDYSYALASNFRPLADYKANIQAMHQPCAVIAGTSDEAFQTDKLEHIFREQEKNWPVVLLQNIDHIGLITDEEAIQSTVRMVKQLQSEQTKALPL